MTGRTWRRVISGLWRFKSSRRYSPNEMEQHMYVIKFGTHVTTPLGRGVIVSMSKARYGVRASNGDVNYMRQSVVFI